MKVLGNVKKKRKVTRMLERQAIMYGIDCLNEITSNLDDAKKADREEVDEVQET